MATPCSVKTNGIYLLPPLPFEVTNCDLKEVYSSFVSLNCNLRTPSDGFAEQNGRDAERAD